MKSIVFPKGLKLKHSFSDYESEVYAETLEPKVLDYGSESVLIFPDVFLYTELIGSTTSRLLEEWMGMAQKITSNLGGSEDIKLIYLSLDDIELSKKGVKWIVTNALDQTVPVFKGNLLKTGLFLSDKYDYTRLTKQLQFMSEAHQDFDYFEYLKSDEVLNTLTTRLDDYKEVECLTSELSTCKEDLSKFQTELPEVNASLEKSKLLMQSQESKLKELTDSLNSREAALKRESEERKNLAEDKAALNRSLEELKLLIQSQESKQKELTDVLDTREAALKRESEERKNLAEDKAALIKSLEELKLLIQSQESKQKELQDSLDSQHLDLEKASEEIEVLDFEKKEMRSHLETASSQLEAAREDAYRLTRDCDDLKASYNECLTKIETLENDLRGLENVSLEKNAIEHDYGIALNSYSRALEKLQLTSNSLNQAELELANAKANQAKQLLSIKALESSKNKLEEEYKAFIQEQAEKIVKLEQESNVLFEQLTLNQLEFAQQCDSQGSQIEQLKSEKKEMLSKLIVAARDNTKLNSRLSKLKLAHNIVTYEKFLLENDSRYKSSILGRAKSALSSVKNIRRKNLLQTRKEDARQIATSEYFQIEWYLETYKDVKESGVNPAEHYLLFGATEARMPSPKFDTLWYLERYPDVKESGVNPLLHYIKYGKEEGRIASPKLIESVSFEKE